VVAKAAAALVKHTSYWHFDYILVRAGVLFVYERVRRGGWACNENNGTTLCELFWSGAFFRRRRRREREREMHVPLRLRSHAAHYLLFHLSSRVVVILSD
jgi:hypothetical protein